MLEYRLDDLGWVGFERLCQALLKATLGVGVESWGGTGDWGNDAYCQAALCYPGEALHLGPFQFQAKFVQGANAAGAKPHALLLSAVKRECQRITSRTQPPPAVYSLLTNVVPSPRLREAVEQAIRDALPATSLVVVHGGNDICSWLHMHAEIVRMFPELLSHRDLAELIRHASYDDSRTAEPPPAVPPCSAELNEKIARARAANRRHDVASSLAAWQEVRAQALQEGNAAEAVLAKLQTALVAAQSERDLPSALAIAEECLQEARTGPQVHRARILQLIGEIHRNNGDSGKAKAALTLALDYATASGSKVDVGFALISLAALEIPERKRDDYSKALAAIDTADAALSALYAEGDEEQRRDARDGLAQCHCFRADVFDHAHPDDALAEWSRALELFRSLGEGWEWWVADTLLRRAGLLMRIGEATSAARDLEDAVSAFRAIENLYGLADCFLKAGELLDRVGRRQDAAGQYLLAAKVASSFENERRASYFHFRYACKLLELKKYEDADAIFTALFESSVLQAEQKLDVIDQMCMLAEVKRDEQQLRERALHTLALTDEILRDAVSPERRRSLLMRKARQLGRLDRTEEALQAYHDAIDRLDPVEDKLAIAECWFQIRGVLQKLGDHAGERDASEKVLAIGGEELSEVLKALTLLSLAQLNIRDQRFAEARAQLDRAIELDPKNPVLGIVESDLRRKLAQFTPERLRDGTDATTIPERDFGGLVRELREWCATYPRKQNSILAVWYFIHRTELWNIFRSMLGTKFLIATAARSDFEALKDDFRSHGDLFVWGTNFPLKPSRRRGIKGVDQVPVPKGFVFPGGITIVTAGTKDATTNEGSRERAGRKKSGLLRPLKSLPVEPYFLTIMKGDEIDGTSPYFVGRQQTWANRKVISFMIEQDDADITDGSAICLPLSEGEAKPNLLRVMQVASDHGAIPIFMKHLPESNGVGAVCDTSFQVPCGTGVPTRAIKDLWSALLAGSNGPASTLAQVKDAMLTLPKVEGMARLLRVYMLRFRSADREIVYPAIVVTGAVP
jgi:tetratricopeptide (TPR) repeat protein